MSDKSPIWEESSIMTATTIEKSADRAEQIKKLGGLIKDIRIAMLTTVEEDGHLHSRPMATQEIEFDGDLWFFTGAETGKAYEVQHDQRVNVSFADPNKNSYVSVSGSAQLVHDKEKAKELWQPAHKAFFPEGVDDPNLVLLKIRVEEAEYWDAPHSAVAKMKILLRGLTGAPQNLGENKQVVLK